MPLTIAHPGVIRQHNSLWLANPSVGDVSTLKRRPSRATPRSFYHEKFITTLVTIAVCIPALLLNAYVPREAKRFIVGWIPGVDVATAFTVLLGIVALAILILYIRRSIRAPVAATRLSTKQAVPLEHFTSVGAKVTNRMPWDKLWDLGRAIAQLDEASAANHRREARERYAEAQKAAAALGLTVDLSAFRDASDPPSSSNP